MSKYILRRILFFIPTLIIISLLAFIISINAPGDPLDRMVSVGESGGEMGMNQSNTKNEEDRWRKKLGLDLPVFYFSITTLASSDTLYKIYDDNERTALKRLTREYGNWTEIAAWNRSLKELEIAVARLIPDSTEIVQFGRNAIIDTLNTLKFEIGNLRTGYSDQLITAKLQQINFYADKLPFLADIRDAVNNSEEHFARMQMNATKYKNYIPTLHFYKYNQYHRWIFGDGNWLSGKGSKDCAGLIRGDFGYSYETKLKVSDVIGERMQWSLFFTLISIFLAYLISLPIGLKAAAKKKFFI